MKNDRAEKVQDTIDLRQVQFFKSYRKKAFFLVTPYTQFYSMKVGKTYDMVNIKLVAPTITVSVHAFS